jgi:hypothetical protein
VQSDIFTNGGDASVRKNKYSTWLQRSTTLEK